jgi:hypothetical protein
LCNIYFVLPRAGGKWARGVLPWHHLRPLGIVHSGGEVRTLGGLLTRLRCRQCRMSPRTVSLVSRAYQAAASQTGAWAGRRVQLCG